MQAGPYSLLPAASYLERKFLAHRSICFKLTKPLRSEAQRALGFDNFFKKLKPEAQDWYRKTVCVPIVLTFEVVAELRRLYQYPKYIDEFKDKVFTKEVSLAMFIANIDKI